MATVRFSKELIDRIEKLACIKMAPAVNRARAQKLDNTWGQKIYDILFGHLQPAINALPDGWIRMAERVTVDQVGDHACNMEFSFVPPVAWPQSFHETDLARAAGFYGDRIALSDHPVWGEFLAEVMAYNQRVATADTRQREFIAMVKTICETYTTLAPALKAWPPLWELLPDNVKDKHREIKVREKTEVKLEIDLNKLTALSAAAKLGL